MFDSIETLKQARFKFVGDCLLVCLTVMMSRYVSSYKLGASRDIYSLARTPAIIRIFLIIRLTLN
jgi:hypothetical protein